MPFPQVTRPPSVDRETTNCAASAVQQARLLHSEQVFPLENSYQSPNLPREHHQVISSTRDALAEHVLSLHRYPGGQNHLNSPSATELLPAGTFSRSEYRPEHAKDLPGLHSSDRLGRHDSYSQDGVISLLQPMPNLDMNASLLLASNISATPSSSSPSSRDGVDEHPIARQRKTRREKPHIELAPDQPLTTQGKPRSRVYVACVQCRTRKIRCDGAKPVCLHCSRRPSGSAECSYDPVPKRRGPDKTPGARQRMGREAGVDMDARSGPANRRRRKKIDASGTDSPFDSNKSAVFSSSLPLSPRAAVDSPFSEAFMLSSNVNGSNDTVKISPPSPPTSQFSPSPKLDQNDARSEWYYANNGHVPTDAHLTENVPHASVDEAHSRTQRHYYNEPHFLGYDNQPIISSARNPLRNYDIRVEDEYDDDSDDAINITSEPSLDFARQTWWDALLSLYSTSASSRHLPALTIAQRNRAATLVTNDIRFLFRASNHMFSFINVPNFYASYCDPEKRDRLQPSLLPAILAIATLMQSFEGGLGAAGRDRAMQLRNIAQGSLEASLNGRWIDEELAIAAWILALFEASPHPLHSAERCASAMVMLDSIIRSLSLTFLDGENPQASRYAPRSVPTINVSRSAWIPSDSHAGDDPCSCESMTLGHRWSSASEHTPLWSAAPGWDETWSEPEIRKEMCRRLCWASLNLTASYSSYALACNFGIPDLFLVNPSNYALLMPGENLCPLLPSHMGKNTIWALYQRAMLLWHSCVAIRTDANATEVEKARFGVNAWLESDVIELALNRHACGVERALFYYGREHLFNVRMIISHEFQRFIPLATVNEKGLFHRAKAEEWLHYQNAVAQRVVHAMHTLTGLATNTLLYRPFFVFWFMSQMTRALTLWDSDNSLAIALDVALALLKPIDYLSSLWPCDEQRRRALELRRRLARACTMSSRPPPLAPPPAASMKNSLPATMP